MGRGSLRVYLGAAPGVGKTVAMLDEAPPPPRPRHRRRRRATSRRTDAPHTAAHARRPRGGAAAHGRPTAAPRSTELDVDAVLARRPRSSLVDELAHTNVARGIARRHARSGGRTSRRSSTPASTSSRRSTSSTSSRSTTSSSRSPACGSRRRCPTRSCARADQVQLVDMSPEALRRRMAHGNIYGPDQVDAALANYFRVGNLSALREIALLWLADRVDEALERYRADQGISDQWPARERVVVALTGGAGSETLLRRGARIATRAAGGDLIACHVQSAEGLTSTDPGALARLRKLAGDLGAEFQNVSGPDVAEAILDHARGVNATQIVVGVSRRSRWQQILRPSIASEVADGSGDIDVHLVPHEGSKVGSRRPSVTGLPTRRVVAGLLFAVVSLVALTAVLVATQEGHTLSLDLLLYPRADRGVRPRRRHLAGAPLRRRRLARRQLVLHRAAGHADHQRPAERPGARGLRPRRHGGVVGRQRRGPPHRAGDLGRARVVGPRGDEPRPAGRAPSPPSAARPGAQRPRYARRGARRDARGRAHRPSSPRPTRT